jgi:ribosomal protein S18 acetylase RimI-like enzyme
VIQYRTFRNTDPPALAAIWNDCFTGRGAANLRGPILLEYFSFAKPYFDPEGLILATADGQPVGCAHAGFGPDAGGGTRRQTGVLCVLGVHSSHRRQGIGSELLRRSEDYLRRNGATELYAGPQTPLNPFTFGLYGGCQSPGFLDSDALARPFLEKHGYRIRTTCQVLQRSLRLPLAVVDARFAAYRQRYEILVRPYRAPTPYQESVLGPLELHEFRLQDRTNGQIPGRAVLWEMETFAPRWNEHPIGVVDLVVEPAQRRQGLAKFLFAQLLRHLQEQYFSLVEVQVLEDNTPAQNLFRGLGFSQVDMGRLYQKTE